MNVGSLFSGIGGIDLGLERAGMRVVFQAESDAWRRSVLAHRFPVVPPAFHDVADVHSRDEAAWSSRRGAGRRTLGGEHSDATADAARSGLSGPGAGGVDLLCGGFPCQDLSVAGRRAGLDGARSSLFFEFARVADELVQPGGYVLIENVPGLLSSNGGRDFAVVLATLADIGFHDLAWRVLDSRHFGVPQRRRRVFVVGRRARGDRCAQILLEPESGGGHFAESGEAREGVAGTLGGGSGDRGWAQDTERMTFVADTLTSGSHPGSNMPGRRREDDTNLVTEAQTFDWQLAGSERTWIHDKPGETRSLSASKSLAVAYPLARRGRDQGSELEVGEANVYNALRAGDGGSSRLNQVLTPEAAVRRLTPRECERLQGFPDDWTALGPDSRRYAALGDAVTVPVAEWLGRRILEHERKQVVA